MMTSPTLIRIPMRPEKGEIWCSINLSLVPESQISELKELLKQFPAFNPQPAFKLNMSGTDPHLLLFHEKREVLEAQESESLFEIELEALADLIDTDAIELTCALTSSSSTPD